jgi:hypothetical protein
LNSLSNWRAIGSIPVYVIEEIEHEKAAPSAKVALALVPADRPPFGLKREIADALAPHVRMLALICERKPEEWEVLKALIEVCYRHLVGGKRGMRQAAGG